MKFLFLVLIFSTSLLAAPAGTKGEDGNFKVSSKALEHMGIHFQALTAAKEWQIPKDALVRIKLSEGVYRRFNGEITFVLVKVLNRNHQLVTINSEDLEAGDEVAVKGVNFLRMAEADLNSETVDNCAH